MADLLKLKSDTQEYISVKYEGGKILLNILKKSKIQQGNNF